VVGQVYAVIDVVSMVFQFSTGLILRFVGVSVTLLLIPVTLLLALFSYFAVPTFGMIAFAKIFDKSMGYSLFRAAKELLYLPLSHEEKTQGKAVVDVFSYRAAKGFASLLLLFLIYWRWSRWLGMITVLLLGVWLVLTVGIVRRYRALAVSSDAVDTDRSDRS
jgi:AAA family ATP:ADP antiporter